MAAATAVKRANSKFSVHHASDLVTFPIHQIISPRDRVFAIGSCFAEEVRKALKSFQFDVYPHYRVIDIDLDRIRVDELPGREHMNFYNAFTILQEFERITGLWHQDPNDFWVLQKGTSPGDFRFQDPYRRLVFGRTKDDLFQALQNINGVMKQGFEAADVFIITYGMTELFVNRKYGKVACQKPQYFGGGGSVETDFKRSSFIENFNAISQTINIIRGAKPFSKIILSVSPVALERTFTEDDIVVANCEGKSILRAVLGEICRTFESVIYLPAYEVVTQGNARGFQADGRHVSAPVVESIMQAFVEAHCA